MYTPEPTESEFAVAGLRPDDFEEVVVEIWPENVPAYRLFWDLQTQWRVGMSGPSGLDYSVLFTKLDRMKLSDDEAEVLEEDVRVMELAALKAMQRES